MTVPVRANIKEYSMLELFVLSFFFGNIHMMPLVSFILLQLSYQWTISRDVSNFLTGEASNIWIDLLALLDASGTFFSDDLQLCLSLFLFLLGQLGIDLLGLTFLHELPILLLLVCSLPIVS